MFNNFFKWTALPTLLLLMTSFVYPHGVSGGDANFLAQSSGIQLAPYTYLGAKHMFTGYDHLLFLAGVVFFLTRLKDVVIYASLFAAGHSITLLTATLMDIQASAYLVDAVIGLSVIYKAMENIGALKTLFLRINTKVAVLCFGLIHGFGLSTKLQDISLSQEGLVANILAFNIGVEFGQIAALALILLALRLWRKRHNFVREAYAANLAIMLAGCLLFGYQITGYIMS